MTFGADFVANNRCYPGEIWYACAYITPPPRSESMIKNVVHIGFNVVGVDIF